MLREALLQALASLGGDVREKGEAIEFTKVLAERRVFFSRTRLVYRVTVRVDEGRREVHVWESLAETSAGLAPGAGAGAKLERYRTRPLTREGTIAEEAALFGKRYSYSFDFAAVRGVIERAARDQGFAVRYSVSGR